MTYLVYTNTIKDVASPITVEADDIGYQQDGCICFIRNAVKDDEKRTLSGVCVATFPKGVWIAVLPVIPKGEK